MPSLSVSGSDILGHASVFEILRITSLSILDILIQVEI